MATLPVLHACSTESSSRPPDHVLWTPLLHHPPPVASQATVCVGWAGVRQLQPLPFGLLGSIALLPAGMRVAAGRWSLALPALPCGRLGIQGSGDLGIHLTDPGIQGPDRRGGAGRRRLGRRGRWRQAGPAAAGRPAPPGSPDGGGQGAAAALGARPGPRAVEAARRWSPAHGRLV